MALRPAAVFAVLLPNARGTVITRLTRDDNVVRYAPGLATCPHTELRMSAGDLRPAMCTAQATSAFKFRSCAANLVPASNPGYTPIVVASLGAATAGAAGTGARTTAPRASGTRKRKARETFGGSFMGRSPSGDDCPAPMSSSFETETLGVLARDLPSAPATTV